MKKILVINGPNLNMLGLREPHIYGNRTYADLLGFITDKTKDIAEVDFYQSNHEGDIIDKIQSARGVYDGIVLNAGGYTHTSVAILDALSAVAIPTVEVHLSDIGAREEFRRHSYVSMIAKKTICGLGFEGYRKALEYFE